MIYRVLLRLFPREFRARFGDEMANDFAERQRDARSRGAGASARLWLRTIWDLAGHGMAERRSRRRERGDSIMSGLLQDIRFAFRLFRHRPAFAVTAIATLALGIGVNVAVFSVLNGVLIRRLPFPGADRLVRVSESQKGEGGQPFNPGNFDDVRQATTNVFQALAALRPMDATLTGLGEAARVSVVNTTPELFDVIGVAPMMGRPLTPADAEEHAKVAVVSFAFWRGNLGSDPNALGRVIDLDGVHWTIVGVMPADVAYPATGAVWLPWGFTADQLAQRNSWYLQSVGRLRPGVSVPQAHAAVQAVFAAMSPTFANENRSGDVADLHEITVARVRNDLLFVQGVAVLVLLIACANLANLLLANASVREQEIAIRASMGATRRRIVRQLLVESGVLGMAGGALGAAIAALSVPAFVTAYAGYLPGRERIAVSGPELVAAIAIALTTTFVFGLVPALLSSQAPWARLIRSNSRAGSSHNAQWLRTGLVAGEVMLALTLLAGASVLIKSFVVLTHQSLGFNSDSVLAAQISLPVSKYPTAEHQRAAFAAALDQLQHDPDVEAASVMLPMPFERRMMGGMMLRDPADGGTANLYANLQFASTGYLDTLRVPLKQGRFFTAADSAGSDLVAVVNEQFAAKWGKNGHVIGMRLRRALDEPWITIVGVIADARVTFYETPKPVLLMPVSQNSITTLKLAVRTRIDPTRYRQRFRDVVKALDPNVPVVDLSTLSDVVGGSVSDKRLNMSLMSGLAALAVLLSAIGIYGVMAFAVNQRRREMGIRMALGAQPGQVLSLIVRRGLITIGIGIAGGLVGAWFLTTLLKKELFQIQPHDPWTLTIASITFLLIGIAACWLPSRRVAQIDPIQVLKVE